MSIFGILAAFGGGLFAAAIGGLPAFIMTGVFAVLGAGLGMAGVEAGGVITGNIAFGPFFGPHIAFAGGVAAMAFAKKKGISENGADIATALAGYNDPSVLIVGGVFGVIGYLFKALLVDNVFAGTVSTKLVTDGPGFTVFCSAIVARLVFGGALRTGDKTISSGNALSTTLTISIGYSLLVGALYVVLAQAVGEEGLAALSGNYAVLIFGTAAIGLIFAEFGQAFFGCHHIVIIAAEAAVFAYNPASPFMAVIMAVIMGTIAGIICDVETNLINSGTDSHIDGPACAIFIMTFVLNAIWG
jgi:hypothetical protein